MHTIRIFLALVLLALAAPAAAAPRDIAIPPALRDWTGWVLHGHERELCPSLGRGSNSKACGWPGELQLDVDAGGARFAQRWEMIQADWIALPGDAQWRPESLVVDARAAPVLLRNGVPMRSDEHTSELQSLMRISYAVFCLKTKTAHMKHVTADT